MTSPFPFFNLDPKLSDDVLNKMNLRDIFQLSLCSKRTRETIKTQTATLERRITATVYDDGSIFVTSSRVNPTIWKLYTKRDVQYPDFQVTSTRLINGKMFTFVDNDPTMCISESPVLDVLVLLEYLLDTFSAKLCIFQAHPINLECWEKFKESKMLHKTLHFWVEPGKVSHEDMRFLLEDIDSEVYSLSCYPGKNFTYNSPLTQKTLSIDYSRWFTAKNLMEMRCKQLALDNSILTSGDLKEFVGRWYNGEDKKFEFLKVHRVEEEDYDMEMITRDLKTIPGTSKRDTSSRFQFILYSYVDYEEGLDMRRPTDGLLASIQFVESREQKFFLFVVWHEPLDTD